MNRIFKVIHFIRFRKKWRSSNIHNLTVAGNVFPDKKVKVGKMTYGKLNIKTFNEDEVGLTIGNFCSIADNVYFLLGGEHPYNCISTYPFKVQYGLEKYESLSKGRIIIEDDVWIGFGSIILSGVHIHQGAIISAGSVVSKDVPDYGIYVNGKIIKKRFEEDIIKELIHVDLSDLINSEVVKNHIDLIYEDLIDINDLREKIKLLSKKEAD